MSTFEHELPVVVVPRRFIVTAPHPSVAVGAVNDGDAVHSMVMLLPCPPIVGGVVSVTVNVLLHVLIQPVLVFVTVRLRV